MEAPPRPSLFGYPGSLAEAARRQSLTPAAISQQIKALERDIGVTLLRRAGRTMMPTAAGHRLLSSAQALLREERALLNLAHSDTSSGDLRLGTINTALHGFLPAALGQFNAAHPHVRVFIQSGTTQNLVQALRDEVIDVAVCLHPSFRLPKSLSWAQWREEPLIVLAPARLAKQRPLQLLREQPFLRYDRSLGGGQQAERFLRDNDIAPRERFELSSLLAIALMVDQGLGVSLVPDIDSPLLHGLRIARLPVPAPQALRRFGVLWHRSGRRSDVVEAFVLEANTALGTGHEGREIPTST
ncbi:LysR family transcriptional regulator [Bordetella genomosp. 10]|uniref:LysR family transcriptional regulator n=1 Tax=Bordetella genomosp. 10 TaxID=1416804 RepID=A0A261S4R3_9BORD|nr:LysR family transcriptional regulator [Bordetella genomosp. 10]OZI32348.1 LysR family transcriptional regulator [Bordetella genomosp. 10]